MREILALQLIAELVKQCSPNQPSPSDARCNDSPSWIKPRMNRSEGLIQLTPVDNYCDIVFRTALCYSKNINIDLH